MNPLEKLIKERIGASGPITFRDFMDTALYHPELGYYTQPKDRVGAAGDFYTSPSTHPVFGALIAVQLQQMWELMGQPEVFTVVEAGAGKGLLARDILDYLPHLSPAFGSAVQYLAQEKRGMTVMREVGKNPPLSPFFKGGLRGIHGCILSNELLDAFPVHRVARHGGKLREVCVTVKDGAFREVPGDSSTPLLEQYLADGGISLVDGQVAEINLQAIEWIKDAAARLVRGFVLTIDYGHLSGDLYSAARKQGTLMTYSHHIAGSDPYLNVGDIDLTSHVDFSAAMSAGESAGLTTLGLVSQANFLNNLGLKAFIRALRFQGLPQDRYKTNRFAMQELARPEGFGEFKVLVQAKDIERATLYGLASDGEFARTVAAQGERLAVPLLLQDYIPLLEGKYPDAAGAGFDDMW